MSDASWAIVGLIGLLGLVGGADKVVDHAAGLMREWGLSGGFVGLTVISVGTSLPEMWTHLLASIGIVGGWREMQLASGTVLGMNVGSDIAQQTLLIGTAGLVGAVRVGERFLRRDFVALVAAATMVWLLSLDDLGRIDGAVLILAYVSYVTLLYRQRHDDRDTRAVTDEDTEADVRPGVRIAWIVGGLVVLIACGELMLRAIEHFVHRFDIAGSLIGVVLIGLATSLPELATAVSGIRKKQSGLSIGTLIGSNVTNPTLAIGIGAIVSGYTVPISVLWYDMPVKIATAALVLGSFAWDRRLARWESVALIALYLGYVAGRWLLFPGADVYR